MLPRYDPVKLGLSSKQNRCNPRASNVCTPTSRSRLYPYRAVESSHSLSETVAKRPFGTWLAKLNAMRSTLIKSTRITHVLMHYGQTLISATGTDETTSVRSLRVMNRPPQVAWCIRRYRATFLRPGPYRLNSASNTYQKKLRHGCAGADTRELFVAPTSIGPLR